MNYHESMLFGSYAKSYSANRIMIKELRVNIGRFDPSKTKKTVSQDNFYLRKRNLKSKSKLLTPSRQPILAFPFLLNR